MKKFSVEMVNHPQTTEFLTFSITGNLLCKALCRLENKLDSLYGHCRGKKVILDLAATHYVSSSGWQFFLKAYKRLREQDSDLVLAGMNPDLQNTFELLELNRCLRHFADVGTAVREAWKAPFVAGGTQDKAAHRKGIWKNLRFFN